MVMLYFPHPHGEKSSGPAVRTVGFFGQATGVYAGCFLSPGALKGEAKAARQALSSGSDADQEKVSNGQDP